MLCSIIIPTIGRETLTRSVESVLNQQFDNNKFEIIVINDAGKRLSQANWHNHPNVQILQTQSREKSIAKNTGAAVARGKYLLFLDDDDWIMPQAFQIFSQQAIENNPSVIFGSTSLVDRQGNPLIDLHHDMSGNCFIQTMAGEWIPNGACWISADAFFELGGYNPLMTVGEDSDLCRRLALICDFTKIENIVLSLSRGDEGTSVDYSLLPSQSRQAREQILEKPGVLSRLLKSAHSSYWYGCIVRIYLTSAIWNIQHKKIFDSISRLTQGLLGFVLSGKHIFSTQYWRAISKPFESFTFAQGFKTNKD